VRLAYLGWCVVVLLICLAILLFGQRRRVHA
jgi:hypothetical protein